MENRDTFKRGDRVKLSPEYWQQFKHTMKMAGRNGTVVGMARGKDAVRIRWDGNAPSSVEYYHVRFVEPADAAGDYTV